MTLSIFYLKCCEIDELGNKLAMTDRADIYAYLKIISDTLL